MTGILNFMKRLGRDDDGATAIEYGLLAALIAVVIIAAVSQLGGTLQGVFENVDTRLGAGILADGGTVAGD